MGLEEKIKEQDLKAENVFVASLLAGLNEFGILNQGIINLTGGRIGDFLFQFAKVKGFAISPFLSLEEQVKKAIVFLNERLRIGKVFVEFAGEDFFIKVYSSSCRFCPKGVGEAELEGTLCPFPKIFERFLELSCRNGIVVVPEDIDMKTLVKREGFCVIHYRCVK
ncbi:hypothetical protein [Desulfurobacterium indicum]|uniref:4-vinyl reductase 4VR domain-containing protein n=1 Tax=Desulfurobacterium indicum TaxID=1914305 RepID=A0A1R1MM66_9BACT|nr:hypothetical protein [Desulfurobacterium indicum]OMH40856.1 hypothetical protein BLW93_02770 [Desulfurobacterium indicum]